MKIHPAISIFILRHPGQNSGLTAWLAYLERLQPVQLTTAEQLPADLSRFDVIITAVSDDPQQLAAPSLVSFVEAGGALLLLNNLNQAPLPDLFGVQPEPPGPEVELRVLFTDQQSDLRTRLPDFVYLPGRFQPLRPTADSVETILYADWRYTHQPMLTLRSVGNGYTAVTSLQAPAFANQLFQQIMYRVVRRLAGQPNAGQTLGVGLLGYAPSVGQLHGQGTTNTAGLALRAACDLSEARLAQAELDFPDIKTYQDAAHLGDDPDVDVVIIATPPSTHAQLSVQMLEAGKHVICEKPLALSTAETEQMCQAATDNQRHLSCHQNRRWDVDYLAIKHAVDNGLLGDLFYLEMFVGDYNHPCGYWHSHDEVSGGTTYDWGAHYLDWMVGLFGAEEITAVLGTRQNRLWHDVTNADQERIQVRLANGQEVDFIHSDMAALRKPKWYALGTEGAILGEWQQVSEYLFDPVLYFEQYDIPPTEMPPKLTLRRREHGRLVTQDLPLPPRVPYAFHRNLADHLLTGEPIAVPVTDSARVVAILEAAARSAAQGGTLEKVHI